MLRDGYNVQFEGTIVRTTEEPTLLRENNIQRDQGWSWIVLFAAFLTLFITNGMHASFGILYAALISHFDSGREETAWIGSISLGLLCFFSPVASVLIEQIGCRATSIIGAFLCSLGFLLSSFATGITLLYFSHGLLFGLGTSLTYTAAMTVVTRSFERRRNIATGLCTSGSQFGGISLAPLSQVLFDRLGYANTFRTFAGLLLVVAISSLAYRSELGGNTSRPTSAKKSPKEMLNVWKSKPYIVWALGTTMVTLGYNIPRYTLAKYATDQGISKDASAWLVSYLCASSAIGRITFGRLCEWIPNLYLCQACIIGCALSAFLYPFLKSYLALVITAIIFGLPDGGFVASLSVVTMEIVGPEKMVEGFGFMLFCQSYSNVIGPPLSGMLYDTYKSYKAAFCFAAVPEIIGALMLFLIPYYRRNQVKYTHEIEYGSNSGILGNEAASTINPISEVPILPTAEPQGEYNVVINLTSDSPDVHLVNVILHRTGETETTGVTCNDGEADKNNITQIQDAGIINKAVQEIEIPVCTGESSTLASEGVNPIDQPGTESRGASVVICNEPESNTMLSAVATGPMKSSSTQTVIHDGEIQYTNNQTINEDRILPSVLSSQISATTARENENQIIDVGVELTEAVQAFPSTQLVAIVSNDAQTDGRQNFETTDMITLGLQIKKSNKSLPLEDSASVGRVVSNTVSLSEGYENQVEEIIHLQTEQDVPKISPPPQHKHHVNKVDVHHVAKADVTTMDCHDNVVDNSPEAILAELDTLVQGSELTSNPLATPFTADVNNQQPSLMKCTGLESGLTQLESRLSQNQESLMLSNTFIPEMTISCVSTAFSTEPSHMSGINDVLTQKQLPEPLKPTSLSSVRGNEQQSCNSQDVPPATSPLSCELSTVIADVIQSLTSQQSTSQKSNKESSISSNMADNPQENAEYTDQPEKKQDIIVVEMPTTKELKFGINVESSSQASSELSSYYKLQTSVLHSMQSIVAEGCPEDIALLEDISIDLTLDKDPSFASVVLIDDVDEQNNTTDLNFPCLSHEPAITPSSGISGQEQGFLGVELSTKHPSIISTQEQHFASGSQDQHFSGLSYEPAIITSSVVSCQLTHEPTSTRPSVIPTQKFPAHEASIARPSAIPNQEQPFLDLTHEPGIITCSVVSRQVSHGPALQQFSSLSSGQAHKHTNAYPGMISSQDQHATALKQEPGIISSSLASSQLPHEPTKTHPSVISTQGGNFHSVVQEPILTNLSPISCQEQHFPDLKQTTNFPCSIVHEPAITLPVSSQGQHFGLPHESNIVNPTDTIALELFSHPAGHDGDIYDGAKSHEQIAKPIESTNPFYQDINQ